MDKKTIYIFIGVAVVLAAAAGYQFFLKPQRVVLTQQQQIEQQLKKVLAENIENWPEYAKVSDIQYKKFGNDASCGASVKGSADFLAYESKAKQGDVFKLDLTNGAYLIYTPNYNNWNNAKLSTLTVQDMRICSSGWLTPLYAYPDKIVWGNITCADASELQMENCQMITRIITSYFTQKGQ